VSQVYYACPKDTVRYDNGAIGFGPGKGLTANPVGHFAKVKNCPVDGAKRRYTCYATGPADTYFSMPAETRINGKTVKGFFMAESEGPTFHPFNSEKGKLA
jgi:hypothetical protein